MLLRDLELDREYQFELDELLIRSETSDGWKEIARWAKKEELQQLQQQQQQQQGDGEKEEDKEHEEDDEEDKEVTDGPCFPGDIIF